MAILKQARGLAPLDFKKLHLMRPGLGLDLQVSTATMAKRVRSEFIGMDGNNSIIVKHPDENKWGSLGDAIYVGCELIVRYILEEEAGEVIAFKSKVRHIITRPAHYLFLGFPSALQSQGLRAEARAAARLPVSVKNLETGERYADGTLLDVSRSGCRLAISKEMQKKIDARFLAVVAKDVLEEEVEFAGEIMNSKADDMFLYYGLKFALSQKEVEARFAHLLVAI